MSSYRLPRIVPAEAPDALDLAAATLRDGGLVVLPTDTVYGVGAALERPEAVARLFVAKGRPLDRPIPVLVSSVEQVARLGDGVDPRVRGLTDRFWPGALTLVVPAVSWLPFEVTRGSGMVGLRMPDHDFALRLIERAGGALAVTSANRSGEPEARTAGQAAEALAGGVDLVIDGGESPGGVPSTVVVVEDGRLRVARQGAIPPSEFPASLDEL